MIYTNKGQLSGKGNYTNGKRDGAWVSYWDNGKLMFKGGFKNGNQEGNWVNYYINGQLSGKGYYKNGKREGPWVFYNKNGIKRIASRTFSGFVFDNETGTYKNGKWVRE